jgi:hypothetical protein
MSEAFSLVSKDARSLPSPTSRAWQARTAARSFSAVLAAMIDIPVAAATNSSIS